MMENENKSKTFQSFASTANSISLSFQSTKVIAIVAIICAVVCAMFCLCYTFSQIKELQRNVYVLDNKGQVFAASAQDVGVTRSDEVKDQSRRFHELFFNLPPDRQIIEEKVNSALDISDKSVYNYYNDLQESEFYRRLISTGSYQQVTVDSVKVDMSRHPYMVRTYASQIIVRTSNVTRYQLITQCRMLEVNRSPKNIHGLEVQNFEVIDNTMIGQRKR